ncbi:hypothetical protein HDK64DRAFT_124098 [Phyllosticta capitalensis]|uniref:NAD-dependent epimerase/dehydratase domain-containing protein n=1 Tax=Phyllosticta capitalensis TaxID=121624 RepID=A0ABR1YJW7_9PEZI
MAGNLVFITGAAGFVGAHVVNAALEAGYRVRGSVRREAQIDQLKKQFGSKAAEFVLVRDITQPDAYDGVLDGVDYIFHVASPLPGQANDYKKALIEPAVLGTTTILEAASKVPSIKRVVITSSVVDLIHESIFVKGGAVVEDLEDEIHFDADQDFPDSQTAYRASKVLARQAAEKFMAKKSPRFSMVSIHPVYIYGRNLLQSSPDQISGTNAALWLSLTGPEQKTSGGTFVHVRDVAELQIKALRPDIPSGERFLASGGKMDWDEAKAFVKEKYPSVQLGTSPEPQFKIPVDSSKAERVFGMKWRPWKEAVSEVVEQQLGISKL